MKEKSLLEKTGEAAAMTAAVAFQAFRPVVAEAVTKVRAFVEKKVK